MASRPTIPRPTWHRGPCWCRPGGRGQDGACFGLANPVGVHRHEHCKWNQAPGPHAEKRFKDGLDIGVLKEEFPATHCIDAQHHGGEQQSQCAQSQASGPEGVGHLGRVVLAFETGDEDLDAHTAPATIMVKVR